MAAPIRTLLQFIVGLFAAVPIAAPPAGAQQAAEKPATAETLTMSAFIARIRQDAGLRERFKQNPRGTLRAYGIDPPPIALPDKLDDTQIARLLNNWPGGPGPAAGAQPPPAPAPGPAVAVYGPPPAPVYGPPPGPR